ncbi:hypothetical protein AAP_03842 [Ascosphaera apis ARSEF 7405]|uniref:F-box domain-containing protein n=1 Tax=Ascosphaera apis ARSEF 7405 TaxID=392613 RepID=A0A167XPD1_9EURO|nr:hypothetical protein AAP_03842 [Ascosphaera apis ARSEF 7405]
MSVIMSPAQRPQHNFRTRRPSPVYATAMTENMLRPSTPPIHEGHLTAAQSTLQIPELLGMIFANLALDGDGYFDATGRQTLLSSAQVNKLWFQEAIRHLWTNPCGRLARPIPRLLGGVAPERRAVYASRICGGSLYAYKRKFGDRESMFMDEILDTIEFPKLRKITLYVQRCEDIVPRIKNHHVDRLLIIDLKHRTRYGYREPASPVDTTLDAIIEQIPDIFPDLEYVEFGYYTRISRRALMRFCQRLPHLKKLNSSLVSFADPYQVRKLASNDEDEDEETDDEEVNWRAFTS